MSSPITLAELLERLQQGGALLLPNNRAARELRSAYAARQRSRGLAAWTSAAAVSWSQWTNGLYNELIVSGAETRLLLNAAQEHALWLDVIAADPPPDSLDSPDAMAELAASAFQLAAAWNATARLRGPASNDDTRLFARWAEEFQRRCTKQLYLASALLESALAEHVAKGTLAGAHTLQMAGFHVLTPAQKTLLDALRTGGTQAEPLTPVADKPLVQPAAVLLESPRAELEFAARWLRQRLEAAKATGTQLRLAVLVPGLAAERAEMEAALRELLAPELQSIAADLSSTPWEFSAGVPLRSLALVTDALDLVRWCTGPLPQTRITALLLSPYLCDDREAAAQVDALLRRKERSLRPELSLDAFVALLEKHRCILGWPRNLATELGRRGDLKRQRSDSAKRSYAEWMETVRELVQAAGWPGRRQLSATEFEAARTWESALDLVATLDYSGKRVTLDAALTALERQTESMVFSPPRTHAPVQIMTPAEAEGSLFDAVLFLRATDANWPAAERIHPLLSWQVQSALRMPGTDPVQSAAQAQAYTQALLERAPEVLFTSAAADADGHLRPSPLLHKLGIATVQAETLVAAPSDHAAIEYDLVADDTPLPPLRSVEVHGGATLLKLQAACGFQAFAQLRLQAAGPESSEIGLDAAESGTLVHKVLHLFWRQVQDRATLESFGEEQRRKTLLQCIDQAITDEGRQLESAWDTAYVQMVHDRLLKLLMQWLDCELERSAFRVAATEKAEDIEIGPLKLRVKMDRIDSVPNDDGSYGAVFIDYKTGASAGPAQWNGERPDEPQLPLYTLHAVPEDVKGVAFAKLRVGNEMRYAGLQAEPNTFTQSKPGRKAQGTEDIPARIAEWRAVLTQLACDFAEGRADVDPKQYPKTCTHCAQRLLCRVDPANFALDDGDENGEETDA